METIFIWNAELLRYKKDNPALYLGNPGIRSGRIS